MAKDDGRRDPSPRGDNEFDSEPVDLAAVHADDALIEALLGHGPIRTQTAEDYELASLLADWRDDIVNAPIAQKPTLAEAEAAFELGRAGIRRGQQVRRFKLVAGAAATFVAVAAVVAVLSHNAGPGSPLWNVKQVVFAEAAASTEQQRNLAASLERAENAVNEGRLVDARAILAEIEPTIVTLAGDDRLRIRFDDVSRRIDAAMLAPAPVPAPTPREAPNPVEPTAEPTEPVEPTSTEVPSPPAETTTPEPTPSAPVPSESGAPTSSPEPSGSTQPSTSGSVTSTPSSVLTPGPGTTAP